MSLATLIRGRAGRVAAEVVAVPAVVGGAQEREEPQKFQPQCIQRLDAADCLELLTETHAEIRGENIQGAFPWALANVPELARRFHDTEAAIDRLAGSRPTEVEFSQALGAHAAVWRELVARYRAHRDVVPQGRNR